MRSLFIIPTVTAAVLALLAAALVGAGVRIGAAEPLAAGIIGCISGILAVLPILYVRPKEQTAASQWGLAGTILHMLCALGMSAALIAAHAVAARGPLAYWLIAGYWISLLAAIIELRRLILSVPASALASTVAKAEK